MKTILFTLALLLNVAVLCAQDNDSLTKKQVIQIGYVTEAGAGNGAALKGIEIQSKFLFGKHTLVNGKRLLAPYLEAGYSYFAGTDYGLGQGNVGLGFTFPFLFVNMDLGVGGVWYHGQVYGESWTSKKIDAGFYLGGHIPIRRGGGIYAKYWLPGGITALIGDTYSSPTLFSVGIQL